MYKNLIRGASIGLLTLALSGNIASAQQGPVVYQPAKGTPVQFNWGTGSPSGFPSDYFEAVFDQSRHYQSGDYFIQTLADDGVKVEVNGNTLINRWSDSGGQIDRALWLGVKAKEHSVLTHYYEKTGDAAVFSNVLPFDSWIAYYYPNNSLSGLPKGSREITPANKNHLLENFGTGGPGFNIGSDHFSARYTTAKRIPAGDYIIRTKADDGFRVLIDGEVVLDRWSPGWGQENATKVSIRDRSSAGVNEKDVHWIEVQYFEATEGAKVDFTIEPVQSMVSTTSWLAEYYPNMSLQGKPVVLGGNGSVYYYPNLAFNWGNGSPEASIPSDRFSARYTKKIHFDSGTYLFETRADDGVRVWVDDQKVIDSWRNGSVALKQGSIALDEGYHTVKVEYFENTGLAQLDFNYHKFGELPVEKVRDVKKNWGRSSPGAGIGADHFTATFDQSGVYNTGDYFIQTFADDGVRVEVNQNLLIDRWSDSAGVIDRALWLGVGYGNHSINTHYYENAGDAAVYSNIVPFDSWVAYYYSNTALAGIPKNSKVISSSNTNRLYENFGEGAPAGLPKDNFSARYTTAKRLPAGDYVIRTKADDGFRVLIDGEVVSERWTSGWGQEDGVRISIADKKNVPSIEKDVHWIEIQYFEAELGALIDFSIEPYENVLGESWLAEYYPNLNLQGTPRVVGGQNSVYWIGNVDFDWGAGSPHQSIPTDKFSARFTKREHLEAGTYLFEASSDDGVRVWIDDQLVIDWWRYSNSGKLMGKATIEEGYHTIKVEYLENTGLANLKVNYRPFSKLETQVGGNVHYNWGSGGPTGKNFIDYFTATFDQSGYFPSGNYFIQTFADDGITVEVEGDLKINRWSDSSGTIDKAYWLGVEAGQYSVKTNYYENSGDAFVFSDVVPFDSWVAYYYPNRNLSGIPTTAEVLHPTDEFKKLQVNYGKNSPKGVPSDNYSARYTTAKKIPAGDYILRTKADDGIKVYVDGQLVVDRWTGAYQEEAIKFTVNDRNVSDENEKDVHWIEVQYSEHGGDAFLEFYLEPFDSALGIGYWMGELYPNTNLEGSPYIVGGRSTSEPIQKLSYNWGTGSPQKVIPADRFSARYTKIDSFDTGTYVFTAKADDGIRVWVDDTLLIDSWKESSSNLLIKEDIYLESGDHKIVVEYYENRGDAILDLDYQKVSSSKIFYSFDRNVAYNWGQGSPSQNIPVNNFDALFDQSGNYSAGDYFIQTFADDGVRVQVDGQTKINRMTEATGTPDQALWLDVKNGYHDIQTYYRENTGDAFIYSNVVPLDSWLAYYYSNDTLTGIPADVKTISPIGEYKALFEDHGAGSPSPGNVPTDHFSARYTTAKRLPAGEYLLRASVDDGYRILIDGEVVLERWTNGNFKEETKKISIKDRNVPNTSEKDIHWIEVQYYDATLDGKIEFLIQPYGQVADTNEWVGYLYPNKTLTGDPIVMGGKGSRTPIRELNFNWLTGTPNSFIPNDNFSGRFVKKAYMNGGTYQFQTWSDDGMRLYVDGKLVIDSWVDSSYDYKEAFVTLNSGIHEFVVEYYEASGDAALKVDIVDVTSQRLRFVGAERLPVYRTFNELADYRIHLNLYNPGYTRLFELGYGDIVYLIEENSYGARVRLQNGLEGWVHRSYLETDLSEDLWLVKDGRTFREGPGTGYRNIGFIETKSMVRVLDYVTTGEKHNVWYYIETLAGQRGWIWGAINEQDDDHGRNLIKYENHKLGTTTNLITPFTPLNTFANVTAEQINSFVAYKTKGKTTLMTGMGNAYLTAQYTSGLNAIYLLAHSGLETGWGTSGIVSSKYNYFGIGAIDSQPAQGAYTFDTKEGGIIAGSIWISENYVTRPWDTDTKIPYYQPTIDNMRYDNSWHQYSTDEAWVEKIAYFAKEFYDFINR